MIRRPRIVIGTALCLASLGCLEEKPQQSVEPRIDAVADTPNAIPALPVAANPPPASPPAVVTPENPSSPPSSGNPHDFPHAPNVQWSGGTEVKLVERFPATAPLRLEVDASTPIDGCSIAPRLPAGLSFHPQECRITGTPNFVSAPQPYTVTAWNLGGETQVRFTLSVDAQPRFLFMSRSSLDRTWNGTVSKSANLWVSSIDGRERSPLTFNSGKNRSVSAFQEIDQNPQTGFGRLLFVSTQGLSGIPNAEENKAANLWTLDVQPEGVAVPFTVETLKTQSVGEYAVTPDRRTVIYVAASTPESAQHQALYSLPLSQSLGSVNPIRLTTLPGKKTRIRSLQISADSQFAYFLSDASKSGVFGLYRVELSTQNLTHLTPFIDRKSESLEEFVIVRENRIAILRQGESLPLLSLDLESPLPIKAEDIKLLALPGGVPSEWAGLSIHPRGEALLLTLQDRILETRLTLSPSDRSLRVGTPRVISLFTPDRRKKIYPPRYDVSGDWILFSSQVSFDPITGSLSSDARVLPSSNLWVTPSTLHSGLELPGLVFPRALTRNTQKDLNSY